MRRSREFELVEQHARLMVALGALNHIQSLAGLTSPSRSTRTSTRARVGRDALRPQVSTERNRFLRSGARTSRLRSAS